MATNSGAKFKIDTSPSSDAGYDALESTTLDLQLEASPALDVATCTYSVFLKTAGAPTPTLSSSGVASPPTSIVQLTLGAGVHSYAVMCQTNGGAAVRGPDGKDDWSVNTSIRIVSVRSTAGLRKIIVGERLEYDPVEGWVSAINELIDSILASPITPYTSTPSAILIGAGSAGAATEYSKGDHAHPVTVGVPTTIAIDTAASAGTGPALAASDHVHEVPPPTTVTTVALVGGIGVNPTFARDDHQHDLAFGVVNSLLGMATAPIDINGQTLTSGGFIGPYFSTSSTPTTATGLLRGIASQVLVAARDDGNSNDVSILAWGVDGTDIVKVGDTFAACLKLSVASGADVRMLDNNVTVWAASKANGFVFADGSNASITYGVAATGANGKSTEFSAQDGDATFNGGSITIKSGAPGAGGSSAGAVVLDSRLAGTASGLINFSANGSAFLRHSYNTGTTRTLVQTGGSNLRFDTTTLELDVTNIALLNATGSFGGGLGVVDWTDATVEPTGDTSTSVRLWAFGTTLKAHNQALTTIAPTVESAPGAEDIRVPDRRAKRVRTTNNTPTTAYSFALPTSCSAFFDVTITPSTSCQAAFSFPRTARCPLQG
jgi:hypothetical protein